MRSAILLLLGAVLLPACATRIQPAPKQASSPPHCLRETGSRIAPDGRCIAAAGRSYSREDLQRTGMPTTAEAIRRAQP